MSFSDPIPSSVETQRKVLFSPAKLNLFFRVLKRRLDGYHEIASLYQCITLGDRLTVTLSDEDRLTCNVPHIPCDHSNLIFKSLNLFRQKTGYDFKVHFHLEKITPVEAGLGGGSSNAATAMWALNSFSTSAVSDQELSRWVAEFSSDAPFFFSSGTAYCSGRGEILEEVPSIPQLQLWIAKPSAGLSTPLVYKHCRPDQFLERDPRQSLHEALQSQLVFYNDLEIPAFTLLPTLAKLKEDLLSLGFDQVVMTGSGTAFFCLGSIESPKLPGVEFFSVSFHSRREGSWYEFPSV